MLDADIKDCAENTLGIQKGTREPYHSDDPKIKVQERRMTSEETSIAVLTRDGRLCTATIKHFKGINPIISPWTAT